MVLKPEIAQESSLLLLKPDRLYNVKNVTHFPESKDSGYVIFLCTDSFQTSYETLLNPNYNFKQGKYNNYITDIFYSEKIGSTIIKENIKSEVIRSFAANVHKELPFMKLGMPFTFNKFANGKNNLIIDLGYWNYLFFKNRKDNLGKHKMVEEYITFINSHINSYMTSSGSHFLYVPIDKWIKNSRSSYGLSKTFLNDPLSIIMTAVYNNYDCIQKLPNVNLLVGNEEGNQLININRSSLIKEEYSKLKVQINKFTCLQWEDEIVDETPAEINPNDNINKDDTDSTILENKVPEIIYDLKNPVTVILDNPENKIDETISTSQEIINTEENTEADEDELLDFPQLAEEVVDDILNYDIPVNQSFKREKTPEQKARIEKLKKIQDIVVSKIDLKSSKIIDKYDFHGSVQSFNENILSSHFAAFERSYNEKRLEYDIDQVMTKLNDADTAVFVTKKEVKDSSDTLNIKKTYTYTLEDEDGRKSTFSFDLPVFIEDRYMYIGGNKKLFQNQFALLPLIKTAPDTVQLVSFYNKIFIERVGKELSSKTTALKKLFNKSISGKDYIIKFGNAHVANKKYRRTLDFDAIAKNIYYISRNDITIYFKLNDLWKKINDLKIDISKIDTDKEFIFGINTKTRKVITIPYEGNISISDWIIENFLTEADKSNIYSINSGKRFMFSQASIQEKEIPLILFLLYADGFTSVLEKSKIKHRLIRNKEEVPIYDKLNEGLVEFADGYLVWDKYPIENSILFNGLQSLPLAEFTIEEMDQKDTYIDLMTLYYEYRNIFIILDMFVDCMIDNKTKEILQDLGLPTDLVSVLIEANRMLANNEFLPENNMHNIRIRNNEILTQLLYKEISNSYKRFRQTRHKKNPDKLSIKKDIVLSKISLCNIVEDVSTLNALLAAEKARAVTYKGPGGINLEEAFKIEKRAYDPTMIGIVGITTSADGNVGVLRQLTMEPNINSTLGYLTITPIEEIDKLNSAQLLTSAELLGPPGVLHDDAPRTSMAQKQSKVMMLLDKATPVIIGNKSEAVIAHHIDDSLAFKAKQDGCIKEITDDWIILEYKDGTHDAIDISKRMLKNGANGIYIESQIKTNHKVGHKFKAKDVIAYDPRAFSPNLRDNGVSMNVGVLTKVAIYPSADKFEDSAPIIKKLADKLATDVVMEETFTLGKNAYIDRIVKIGDHVHCGDELISFDESYDDPEVNKFFEGIRDELKEELIQSNIQKVAAKHSGEIVDIKIYSTIYPSELSDSLRELVNEKFKKLKKRNDVLDKYKNKDDLSNYKCSQIISEDSNISASKFGVLKGYEVGEGVLISIFIKHNDTAKKGDKLTNYTALKGVISTVIDPGYEAFSEYRPEEPIETSIAPGAILARKTPSILLAMFGNKCMIEFTRQLRDFYMNN